VPPDRAPRPAPLARTPARRGARPLKALGAALLLVGLIAAGRVASAPGQYITDADATAVDLDGDGLYDLLNVSVSVQAPAEGSYNLRVTLAWPIPSTPTPIASRSEIFHLDDQPRRVTLPIEGPRIREKGLNGPYEIQVDLVSSPSGPVNDAATFPTAALLASDFEAGADTGRPQVVWNDANVTLASADLSATVNLTAPTVEWVTGPGATLPGRFAVSFPSVVSFNDDGDGALAGAEEPLCEAALGSSRWSVDSLEIGPSPGWGSAIEFRLSGPVRFGGPPCPSPAAGNVSLSFLIGQQNGTVAGPSPFTLLGGLEVKVDVALTLDGPVAGDALALEVTLQDIEANTSFRVRGPSGFETFDPRNATAGQEALSPAVPQTPERVVFTDAMGAVRGHFSWVPVASERLAQGQERFVEVTASRGAAGSMLRLFLAVPNDPDLRSLTFDPAVGVPPPAALPQGTGDGGPEPPRERPSAAIFVSALLAVAAIFFFSVYARAKKY